MLVGQATPSSPITTRFVLFDTWMAPRTVELWQKVKGALDVEVTAPVIFESTTDSSWPLLTVMAPSCVAFFRHVVPGPLRVMVPECAPVMVFVHAPVAKALVVVTPSPDMAATASVPARMAKAIFGIRRKLCVMSLPLGIEKARARRSPRGNAETTSGCLCRLYELHRGASPIFRLDALSRRGLEREPAQNGLFRLGVYAHRQWTGAVGIYGKAAATM